jgi:hypothetical protein
MPDASQHLRQSLDTATELGCVAIGVAAIQ